MIIKSPKTSHHHVKYTNAQENLMTFVSSNIKKTNHNKMLLGQFVPPNLPPTDLEISDIRLDNVFRDCYNGLSTSNAHPHTTIIKKSDKPNTCDPPRVMQYLLKNQIQTDRHETRKKAQVEAEKRLNMIRPKKNIYKDSKVNKVLFLDNSKVAKESDKLRTERSVRSRPGVIDTDFSSHWDSGKFKSSLGFGIVDPG
jgi:hypothetical protein